MKHITTHQVAGLNEQLTVRATDDTGPGGAYHRYEIEWRDRYNHLHRLDIPFQKGGVHEKTNSAGPENGVNGVSNEAFLAVVLDRLRCLQAGPYPSPFNAEAIDHIQAGLDALHARTLDRLERKVEGQHKS